MGDYFQTIVDRDVAAAAAGRTASDIVGWLTQRGVIAPDLRECILGLKEMGHPPGPHFRDIVEYRAHDLTLELKSNGLEVVVGRTVFHAGQFGLAVLCNSCGCRIKGGNPWANAVGEWFDGRGEGNFTCPNCGHAEPVTEWSYDPPWGFGNLGFTFWNWPPLKPSFVAELSHRLGHRTVFVSGKL